MTPPHLQMQVKPDLTQFQVLPGNGAVDHSLGLIKGVSVMTVGPALGHGITVDTTGLQQCLDACLARGSVRLIDRHDAEFEGIVGAVTNFRIEGNQVKGDAELFENHPMRSRILEIAQKIPSEFGLSIESSGNHEDDPDNEASKFFRCDDVDAIALVPRPAANKTGLFSARQLTPRQIKVPKTNFSKTMSQLKAKLTSAFAKLEEGDPLDNVIDAIVSAVTEPQDPTIEDRLKKLEDEADPKSETSMSARLSKLEENFSTRLRKLEEATPSGPDEDKEKEAEEKMSKLASKIADDKITKFTAEIGLKRAPGAAGGFTVADDKTKFEAEISTQLSAGAKNRSEAIFKLAKAKPEVYNDARNKGLI